MRPRLRASRAGPAVGLCALGLTVCTWIAPTARAAELRIVVGIPPVAGMVRAIAGPDARVQVLLPRGRSPHSFTPALREVLALRRANVLIFAGLPFERALAGRLRDLAPQARVLELPVEPEAGASREQHAAHWWLDPLAAARAARAIGELLALADPPAAATCRARAARLAARLERLDALLRLRLAGYQGRLIVTSGELLEAVAPRYGLDVLAIEHEGKPPSLRQLVTLLARARAAGVRTIFVARGHPLRGAWAVAGELDAQLVVVDPLAEDVPRTIRTVFDQLVRALDAQRLARATPRTTDRAANRSAA